MWLQKLAESVSGQVTGRDAQDKGGTRPLHSWARLHRHMWAWSLWSLHVSRRTKATCWTSLLPPRGWTPETCPSSVLQFNFGCFCCCLQVHSSLPQCPTCSYLHQDVFHLSKFYLHILSSMPLNMLNFLKYGIESLSTHLFQCPYLLGCCYFRVVSTGWFSLTFYFHAPLHSW